MTKDTSPPAFPFTNSMHTECGLTKREWFAGMTLQGMDTEEYPAYEDIAKTAYRIADAMLKEGDQ